MEEPHSYMPASKSDVHITPDRVWGMIWYHWEIPQSAFFDPCPVDPHFNGLAIPWHRFNFVNPPYSNGLLGLFVAKAHYEAHWSKCTTVMLLPAKTDQDWFHDYILDFNYEIKWIHKRLHFKNNKWSATQPHFLVLVK